LPVLSGEDRDIEFQKRRYWEYFWLSDPLDGTKEFIAQNGEFTVNIALIKRATRSPASFLRLLSTYCIPESKETGVKKIEKGQ
jgi:3'-phosphoadenosine 5'-phosphosulfate (PAPS) 3'-phosphatase